MGPEAVSSPVDNLRHVMSPAVLLKMSPGDRLATPASQDNEHVFASCVLDIVESLFYSRDYLLSSVRDKSQELRTFFFRNDQVGITCRNTRRRATGRTLVTKSSPSQAWESLRSWTILSTTSLRPSRCNWQGLVLMPSLRPLGPVIPLPDRHGNTAESPGVHSGTASLGAAAGPVFTNAVLRMPRILVNNYPRRGRTGNQ